MNIAPIQMVGLTYRRVSVEADFQHLPSTSDRGPDAHALLEGVEIKTDVSVTPMDVADPRGKPYFVTLRVRIDNDVEGRDSRPEYSPYLLDIEAGATIVLNDAMQNREDAQQLVVVNGPSLIWGAIREQVATLTSRMPPGMALLPSVNFHDLKSAQTPKSDPAAGPTNAEPAPPAKRPRSRKS